MLVFGLSAVIDTSSGGAGGGDCFKKMMKGGAIRVKLEAVECSMCGDVGLQDKLFLCKTRDCHRHQHTYCSSWYPVEKSTYEGMCNWCAAATSGASAKANGENMSSTTYSGKRGWGAAASSRGTIKGGTMGRQNNRSAAVPLKILTGNNINMTSTGSCSGGEATPKAAVASPKSPPAMRTPAGRRYKLVSEM